MWLGRERGERRDPGREVVSVEPDCRALKPLPLTARAPAAEHPTYCCSLGASSHASGFTEANPSSCPNSALRWHPSLASLFSPQGGN